MTVPVQPIAYPPTCVVTVDGARLADGRPGDSETAPTVLSELAVEWGRNTALDQPAPASCTFRVLDVEGGQRYLDWLRVGGRTVVTAAAVLYGAPSVPIALDPSFEAEPAGPLRAARADVDGAAATVAAAAGATGARGVRLDPITPDGYVTVTFPPAPYGPPTSWDALPRTVVGQRWAYGASIRALSWLGFRPTVMVAPVEYTGPSPAQASPIGRPGPTTAATDAWQPLLDSLLPTVGVWVGVRLSWPAGRPAWSDLGGNPAAGDWLPWSALGAAPAWSDVGRVDVDDLVVQAPPAGAERAGVVFSGRITDLVTAWDFNAGAAVVTVTAQDDVAELGNRYVGAAPWPAESVATRFGRVVTESGQPITWTVDAGVAGRLVSARDVDNQAADGLLGGLARSVGGVLWAATSTAAGAFLRLEDVDARPPLQSLVWSPTRGLVVIAPSVSTAGITIDACLPELSPIRWTQTTGDDASRVDVGWIDQTTSPSRTGRTASAVDAALERTTGQRRVSVSTELTTDAEASKLASVMLGRLETPGWRLYGLAWSIADDPLDSVALDRVMRILDGSTRLGLPILLVNLPTWAPIAPTTTRAMYLEGGRFTNRAGGWRVELLTSSAAATGAPAVAWSALPVGWRWQDFDPAIRWSDLAGVGVTP